jgi:hypothetical protein
MVGYTSNRRGRFGRGGRFAIRCRTMKGKFEGTAGRGPCNDIMERVADPKGVTFEAATVSDSSFC